MKKYEIVKSKRDFSKIIHNKKFLKNEYIVLYMMKSDLPYSRFGITVPTKLCNAVGRNHLKRQFRNIVDEQKLLFQKGFDYIIMIRKDALGASYQDLFDSLKKMLEKR